MFFFFSSLSLYPSLFFYLLGPSLYFLWGFSFVCWSSCLVRFENVEELARRGRHPERPSVRWWVTIMCAVKEYENERRGGRRRRRKNEGCSIGPEHDEEDDEETTGGGYRPKRVSIFLLLLLLIRSLCSFFSSSSSFRDFLPSLVDIPSYICALDIFLSSPNGELWPLLLLPKYRRLWVSCNRKTSRLSRVETGSRKLFVCRDFFFGVKTRISRAFKINSISMNLIFFCRLICNKTIERKKWRVEKKNEPTT